MELTNGTEINTERLARDIIAIGGSAGGIPALLRIVSQLSPDIPATIVIALHRSASAQTKLSLILARRTAMRVVEPDDTMVLGHGVIYLAPRDRHMVLEDGAIRVTDGPKEHHSRPAIDPLFRSAAAAYAGRVVGVLLSGLGLDGVAGLTAIKKAQGLSFVQNPEEAEFPAMPTNAISHDHVDAVVRSVDIPDLLEKLAAGKAIS